MPPSNATLRKDPAVLLAALGSSAIALPGLYGLPALLDLFAGTAPFSREDFVPSLTTWGALVGTVIFILLGLYLLAGYWRILLGYFPGKRRGFWLTSAGYNAVAGAVTATALISEALHGTTGIPLVLSIPATGWTGFMMWLGMTRSRVLQTK